MSALLAVGAAAEPSGDDAAKTAASPSPSPSPDTLSVSVSAAGDSGVKGAEGIMEAVSAQSRTVGSVVQRLDSYRIDLGNTYVSLWSALVLAMVLVGVLVFARVGNFLAKRLFTRLHGLDPTQRLLGEKLVSIAIWAVAILIGIDVLGIDLTALAVFSGAFGLAIGFGLQKTFGNLIAGIILLMDRSIKPGDVIAVSDMTGRESFGQIRKIGIRAVSVVTRDMKEYLIPNENLMINQVENWSYSSREVRVKVPVGVSYRSDIELVEKLMLKAADDSPRIMPNPPPRVLLIGFGESAVNLEIRFWITDPEEGTSNIRSDVLKRVWVLFHENDIEIPFPQRDLNLRDNQAFRELLEALREQPPANRRSDG